MEAVSHNSNSDYHTAEEDVYSLPPPIRPQDCASADGRFRSAVETAGGTPGRPLLSTPLRPSRDASAPTGLSFVPIRPKPRDAALPVPQFPTHGVPAAAPPPPPDSLLGLTNKRKSRETPAGGLARKFARGDDCSRFPCPFHQNNPEKFSTGACSGPGFKDHRRLKEHIDRVHGIPEWLCNRCLKDLASPDELYRHHRVQGACHVEPDDPVEGLLSPLAAMKLRSRSQWPKGVPQSEKCKKTYSIVFPGSDVPPHHYGPQPSSWSDIQPSRATVHDPAGSVHSLPTHNTTSVTELAGSVYSQPTYDAASPSNCFDNVGPSLPRLATNDAEDVIAELCTGLPIDEETRSELARRYRDWCSIDAQASRSIATSRPGLESVWEDDGPAQPPGGNSNNNAAHFGNVGHDVAGLPVRIAGVGAQLPLPASPAGELNYFDEKIFDEIGPRLDFERLMAVTEPVEELGLTGRTP